MSEDDAADDRIWWPSYPLWKVVIIVLAGAFLAATFGYWLGKPGPLDESSVEVGFLKDMTHHHEQAVQMAVIEQENGADPVIVGFATEILRRQSYELGVMATMLDRFGSGPEPNETAMAWMGEPTPVEEMPGLATEEQMAQLRAAKGPAADALFLELMTAHHRGGVHMATYAYEHAGADSVRDLEQRMAYVQATEINEFRDTAQRAGIDVVIDPQAVTVPDPSGG
jgi:uncharacterized protein (DUF305 family)